MSPTHALSLRGKQLGRWLGVLTDAFLGLTIVIVPGITAGAFDRGELYRQALLLGLVAVAFAAYALKAAVERRLEVVMGWPKIVFGLFGLVLFVSSCVSVHPYLSFVGQFGQRSWAFSTIGALMVFAWLLSQRVRTAGQIYNTIFLGLVGGLGVGVAGLWSLFRHEAFNATGSVYALSVYAAIGLVMALGLLFHGYRSSHCLFSLRTWPGVVARGCVGLTVLVSTTILLAVNFWLGWVTLLVGIAVLVVAGWATHEQKSESRMRMIFPIGFGILAVALLALPLPWKMNLSGELALSQQASWGIAQQALVAHPLLGTGPGTWIYQHSMYRPQAINLSPYWATPFDRGLSLFMTLLVTTGMAGAAAFVLLGLSLVVATAQHIKRIRQAARGGVMQDDAWYASVLPLAGMVSMLFISANYNFNISHQVLFWMLVGCLLSVNARRRFVIDGTHSWGTVILPMKAMVACIILIAVGVLGGQTVWAEISVANVIAGYQAGTVPVDQVIQRVQDIRTVYPWNDFSARTLSQAYLIKVLAETRDKPASEQANAVGDDVAKMVDAALVATQLAPANADNWSNSGLVYGSIAGFTREADAFALKNYQEAIYRDPQNPIYPTEIGKIYILRAQQAHVFTDAKDVAVQAQAKKDEQASLEQAVTWLKAAIALKSDYMPARYQLAVALDQQGKAGEAVMELEQVVAQQPSADRLFELGVVYARAGSAAKAIQALEKVVSMDATQMRARWQLVSLYESTGRLQDALKELRIVAASVPTNEAVKQRLAALEARVKGGR